ncbi:MAG: 3-oxoadipate enol-lactonase [Ferruginibacter sp.]
MHFINLNGILVHYVFIPSASKACSDNTFVFINALGTDFRIWDETVAILKNAGNVLLFDKRGHGLSGTAVDTRGLDDFADDVLALLKHLSIEKVTVVGLSVGGMIAQLLAYHHPEIINKLVLCDTSYKIGNNEIWNHRIAAVKEQGLQGISDGVMQRWFSEKFREEQPARVMGYQNMLERTPPLGYIQTCEAIRDADLAAIAKQVNVATLCLVGSEDKSTTPADVKALAGLVEGAAYEVIDGSGHLPCVDNPGVLTKLIIDFING